MSTVKITSWNVEHLSRLIDPPLTSYQTKRRDAIVEEIESIDADILCLIEGPRGEEAIDKFTNHLFGNKWRAVKAADGKY